jgi:hypothetical protein
MINQNSVYMVNQNLVYNNNSTQNLNTTKFMYYLFKTNVPKNECARKATLLEKLRLERDRSRRKMISSCNFQIYHTGTEEVIDHVGEGLASVDRSRMSEKD